MSNNPRLPQRFSFVHRIEGPDIQTVGREKEIEYCLDVLYKTRMRNLLILGPSGVGKTHLVYEVSKHARDHIFYEVNIGGIVAGMKYVGDFEKRVEDLFEFAMMDQNQLNKRVVLFFDEIHAAVGAGTAQSERYELDLAQQLKPWLSKGYIGVWGATTKDEYEAAFVPDKALIRRFDKFYLDALSETQTLETLRRFCNYELSDELLRKFIQESGVGMLDDAIERLDRYLGHMRRIKALGEFHKPY